MVDIFTILMPLFLLPSGCAGAVPSAPVPGISSLPAVDSGTLPVAVLKFSWAVAESQEILLNDETNTC